MKNIKKVVALLFFVLLVYVAAEDCSDMLICKNDNLLYVQYTNCTTVPFDNVSSIYGRMTCIDECINKECVPVQGESCTSDPIDPYVRSLSTVRYSEGVMVEIEDQCINNTLTEYVCDIDINGKPVAAPNEFSCANSCTHGACQKVAGDICRDTDNGILPDTGGGILINGQEIAFDTCGTYLTEYY